MKHYQGSTCFPFPEFPFEFSRHYLFICASFPVHSLVPQPPGSDCDQQGIQCITYLKHKIVLNSGGSDVEDSIRHPETQLCPTHLHTSGTSVLGVWQQLGQLLFLWNIWLIVTLVQETTSHLYLLLCLSPFLILGALGTCISKYIRKLCSRI